MNEPQHPRPCVAVVGDAGGLWQMVRDWLAPHARVQWPGEGPADLVLVDATGMAGQERLMAACQSPQWRRVPLVVKIAPDLTPEAVDAIADVLPRHGIDGVIATNTTLSRDTVQGLPNAQETGGLSGPPVHALSLAVIERLRAQLGPDYPIIGVGGIASGKQAREKIQAGADAIQLYTGLIYRGPALVTECAQELARPGR